MRLDERVRDHIEHARHNEALAQLLERDVIPHHPSFADWVIVVMFYSAFHYTKAKLLRDFNVEARIHRSRRDETGDIAERGHNDLVSERLGEEVAVAYKMLFDAALEARYRSFFRKYVEVKDATSAIGLFRLHLDAVREACIH